MRTERQVEMNRKSANPVLEFTEHADELTKGLSAVAEDEGGKSDRHLSPWLALPGKDNGFDIEGVAVSGERVFLGLRGPVLRGWAVVLELHPEEDGAATLGLKKIGPQGRRVVWPDEFGGALTIPHGVGVDRAEGMTLVP